MILRRLTTALRKQDWVTVIIETLIVVFGVYLGIQLGNWNAAQNAKTDEARMIERLTRDFEKQAEILERRIAEGGEHIAYVCALQKLVIAGTEPEDRTEVQLMVAHVWSTMAREAPPASYEELAASGGFSQLSDVNLRDALSNYGQANALWSYIEGQSPAVTDPQSPLFEAIYVDEDFMEIEMETNAETYRAMDYDWDKLRQSRAALSRMIAYFYNATYRHENDLEAVRKVLEALEAAQ